MVCSRHDLAPSLPEHAVPQDLSLNARHAVAGSVAPGQWWRFCIQAGERVDAKGQEGPKVCSGEITWALFRK